MTLISNMTLKSNGRGIGWRYHLTDLKEDLLILRVNYLSFIYSVSSEPDYKLVDPSVTGVLKSVIFVETSQL